MSDDSTASWTLLLGVREFTVTAEAAQAVLDALRGPRRQRLVIVELDGRPTWVATAHVAALAPITTQTLASDPARKATPIIVIADHAHRARRLT